LQKEGETESQRILLEAIKKKNEVFHTWNHQARCLSRKGCQDKSKYNFAKSAKPRKAENNQTLLAPAFERASKLRKITSIFRFEKIELFLTTKRQKPFIMSIEESFSTHV
jgi:hypothetical protein